MAKRADDDTFDEWVVSLDHEGDDEEEFAQAIEQFEGETPDQSSDESSRQVAGADGEPAT